MTAPAESKSISFEFDLPHSPGKVWRALTESELLARWLMANDLQPTLGHKFNFKAQPMPWWDGIVHCEVLEIEPLKRLQYTWRGGQLDTVVTWTLTQTATGTRLALEHSGFLAAHGHAFEGARDGWRRMVGGMTELLARVA